MKSKNSYDVAVIGLGSMGMGAAYHLAKSGLSVVGFEKFAIHNEYSSHSGDTRLIRKSYFEHPDYVPLLDRAYQNWRKLEDEFEVKLFHEEGLAYMGDIEGSILSGVIRSSEKYEMQVEHERHPAFAASVAKDALFEPSAGYLDVSAVFESYMKGCRKLGVAMYEQMEVVGWEKQKENYVVKTNKGIFHAKKVVLSMGPWTNKVTKMPVDIKTTRQVLAWFTCADDTFDMPCWCLDHPQGKGIYYGFSKSDKGFKIGHHYPGQVIDPADASVEITNKEIEELHAVLNQLVPTKDFEYQSAANCIYSMTKDEHFIVDFLPNTDKEIVIAGGFSGHGFKFVSAIGEVIAEMIQTGDLVPKAEFLNINRFR